MRNKNNITIIGAVVVVLVIILGGFGWHHHKQANELNGEWVSIYDKDDGSNLATAEMVAPQVLSIKGHKYQVKTQFDYRHGRGGKIRYSDVGFDHKGTFKLNRKEQEATFVNEKDNQYISPFDQTMTYKLSTDKNTLMIITPNSSPFTHVFSDTKNTTAKYFIRKDSTQYKKWHKEAMKYAKTHHITKDYQIAKNK
ncbi:hypothetical protein LPAF129_09170 [Ligilactobacillus pabuli]|uniref:Uncharacterized protein n=1 Tax=Ligilactobacillus pabuli TaxID=2886039 RepID=A0ABQ5JGN2_9LACO|nr:hypothetical protein [Ligilactobacillus pabuli]GKS81231.1 hypothetical protein LPAF129_09170 [Ligilactobacillus pabuli]